MNAARQIPLSEKGLFRLSWPILFELCMLFMIPAVDAYYITKVSQAAVASVTAILPLTGLGMIIFIPVTQAAASIASQHLGAGKYDRAQAVYTYLLLCNLLLGCVMATALFLSASILPHIVGLPGDLQEHARAYVFVLSFGYIALALRIACGGILGSLGLTKWNMVSAVVMNLLNWLFNDIFINGAFGFPEKRVEAVALSSCLAWLGSLLVSIVFVIAIAKFKPRLHAVGLSAKQTMSSVLRIAVPSTLEPACYQLSQVAISKILVQLGALSLTTKAYLGNITLLPLLWGAAFAQGTQIKIAFLLGQREFAKAQSELIKGLKIALAGASGLSLLLIVISDKAFGLFTQDPEVLKLGFMMLWIAFVLELGRCLNVVVGSALRASGDARFVALFGALSMWLIAVLGSYGLAPSLGLIGIWAAMACDEHCRGWVSLWRWRKGAWQSKVVYARPSD